MSFAVGLLLAGIALAAAWSLEEHVRKRRDACTEMLGMMVGMAAGMTTGLVVGEVAGFFTNMFWGNLLAVLVAAPFGGYLGRHGRLLGILEGTIAGGMGGMMGAMLGVMLQFSAEFALITAVLLVVAQVATVLTVGQLVSRAAASATIDMRAVPALPWPMPDYYGVLGLTPPVTRRDVAAAYLVRTDPGAPARSPEQQRLLDEALAVLSDPLCRTAYDRARASNFAQCSLPAAALAEAPSLAPRAGASASELAAPPASRPRGTSWGVTALVAFAVIAFGLVAARPATAECPAPKSAAGLPTLPPAANASAGGVTAPQVDGKQVVNLTVQFPCYYPEQITVQRGVPVQFNVGTVGEAGCGRQVVLQGLGIGKYVPPGRVATFEFTPERTGAYGINCGMSMMKPGTLRVVD